MSESSLKPDNLNYKSVAMHNGRYRLRKIPLNNITGSSVTLQPSSTTLLEWKLPAGQVFNPARSSIEYSIQLAANAKSNWNFEDCFEICQSIQFCNASGMYLTDLQYAGIYTSAVRKIDIAKADFECSDNTSGLYRAIAPASNPFPPVAVMPAVNAYRAAASAAVQTALTAVEPQYAAVSAAATAATITRSVPLSCFTQTALGQDLDMIFSEDMYIRMQVASSDKVGFLANAGADPTAGATAFQVQPIVSNLYLQLAMQVDEVIVASVKDKFLRGDMAFSIPFVYGWSIATATGVASVQLQLNNQYGKLLKRLIHVPIVTGLGVTPNQVYDHQNLNGAKISSYQTFLDSVPLQDSVLSCLQPVANGLKGMDDYRENRMLLRGSAIESSLAYYFNWVHIDSFSQPKRDHVLLPLASIMEGLDLTFPRQWTMQATTATPLTNYIFGTFVRQVLASPQGTQILVA